VCLTFSHRKWKIEEKSSAGNAGLLLREATTMSPRRNRTWSINQLHIIIVLAEPMSAL
jgi:hypothetical protein